MSRALCLPWEGIEALRTVLGILDDHEVRVDDAAKETLEQKLLAAPQSLGPIASGEESRTVAVALELPEARVVLQALQFTDSMSTHLPFYDMIVETIQFVGDQITDLWTTAEWMAFNDSNQNRSS
jgi:hypothetical protein